jgi:hypothetical protein
MSRVQGQDPRDPELERLLAKAGRPGASPAFRARLKEQFLATAGPVPDVMPPVMVPRRTRMFPFLWPFVLAASVAFILHYVISHDANVRWHVVGTEGGGEYVIDGRRMHSSETGKLLDAVQTAHEIETFDAGLRLQLADDLMLDLAPKTRVSQLSFPAAHVYSIYANVGSLRITTGPNFPGNRLRVMTDDMETAVVGTTFALDVEALGTCLCCIDGTVKCDARDTRGMQPADAGRMCFAFHTGKKPLWGEAVPQHVEPLEKLKSFAAAVWKKK